VAKAKSTPYAGTQSVLRAVALLKLFDDARPEWRLTELAQETGLNKTTTYRLLSALSSEGMVAKNPQSDTYRLGPQIVTLGGRALRANELRIIVRPELQRLALMSGETASLEILTGDETLILDEIVGAHVMSGGQAIGTRWPAYATSTGKALMAALPPGELEEWLLSPIPALTPKTITSSRRLEQELAQIREQGYAVADEELELGLVAVGAALHDFDRRTAGAICLSGPTIRFTPDRIGEIGRWVREAARRISIQLGFPPGQSQ
jgi:DNA-binding IclR family transcriptional regulator